MRILSQIRLIRPNNSIRVAHLGEECESLVAPLKSLPTPLFNRAEFLR